MPNLHSEKAKSSELDIYVYPGGQEESIQARLEEYVSVTDFGATGNGSTDDTAAIQNAINSVFTTGGNLYFPEGTYNVSSTLVINRTGISGIPGTTPQRMNINGAGKGNAVIRMTGNSMPALQVIGDPSGSGSAHIYSTITNLAFVGASSQARTATGLELTDCAYMTVKECTFHNLGIGMFLNGSLSCYFSGLIFNESTYGVNSSMGGFSAAHANLFAGCEFRFCTVTGYNGQTGTSQVVFEGCQFEACGTMGNAWSGGAMFQLNSAAGEVGPSFYSCYFEVNKGGFDIYADATNAKSAGRVALLNIYSCNFNRVGNDAVVLHPIWTVSAINLNVRDCAFTGFGGYAAPANAGYYNLSGATNFTEIGNRYSDAAQKTVQGQSLSFAGYVNGSAGSSVAGTLPTGWTSSKVSKGVFKVQHNLGTPNYAVVGTTNTGNGCFVERVVMSNNNVQFVITNAQFALVNDDFSFILQPF